MKMIEPQRFTLRDDRNGARITNHKYGGYVYYSDYKDLERKFQEMERLSREVLLGGEHDGLCEYSLDCGWIKGSGPCIWHLELNAERSSNLRDFLDVNL